HDAADVEAKVGFAKSAATDKAQHHDAGLGVHDLGREARLEGRDRGRALAVAEDVMGGNVVAAAHDVFAPAILGEIGDVGETALERLQGHRTAPTGEVRNFALEV